MIFTIFALIGFVLSTLILVIAISDIIHVLTKKLKNGQSKTTKKKDQDSL